jgi:hypothetical protein
VNWNYRDVMEINTYGSQMLAGKDPYAIPPSVNYSPGPLNATPILPGGVVPDGPLGMPGNPYPYTYPQPLPYGVMSQYQQSLPGGVVPQYQQPLPSGVVPQYQQPLPGGIVPQNPQPLPGGVVPQNSGAIPMMGMPMTGTPVGMNPAPLPNAVQPASLQQPQAVATPANPATPQPKEGHPWSVFGR